MFYARIILLASLLSGVGQTSAQFYYGKYAEQHVIELIERYIEQHKSNELQEFLKDDYLIINENSSCYLKEKAKKVFETIYEKQAVAYFATKGIASLLALASIITLVSNGNEDEAAAGLVSLIGSLAVFAWPWKNERAYKIMELVQERINRPY